MGHVKRRFERKAMQRIRRHAAVIFRDLKCYHTKQDKIQDVLGISYKWYKALCEAQKASGKNPDHFIARLADFACRQVRSGRTLAGKLNTKDVLAEITQHKRGFYVGALPEVSHLSDNPIEEALHDNTQSDPADQAIFRLTWPVFMGRRSERDQKIVLAMIEEHRTKDIARMHNVSEGRISQMRRELYEDWSSL